MNYTKPLIALGSLAMLPTHLITAQNSQDENNRPNILFILSDDHTSQTWGIYGSHLAQYAQTQNIRRLAAEGVVLDNCFCTNSISVPSRASILTGDTDAQSPRMQEILRSQGLIK